MKLNISKEVFNEAYYPMLFNYENRWEVYYGGSGSGKSYFIMQKLVLKALKEKRRILCTRKFGSTLKNTVWQSALDTLDFFKIRKLCKINKTDRTITFPNGSMIIMLGLDDEHKLLSLQNISDIFIEEVYEVERDIVEQLNLRMRGKASNQQIILAYNPISANHWLYEFVEENPPKSFFKLKTTYKDNKYVSEEYVNSLIDMKRTNPAKARVFVDGEYGIDLDAQVIKNWEAKDFDVNELLKNNDIEIKIGMDLGWIDPTTIAVSLYDEKNKTIYVIDEYYKRGATLDEVAAAAYDMRINKQIIYCDSAEPRTISFFNSQDLNVKKATKGRGSVESGIAFLQNHKIVVLPKCENTIKELENFVYLKDKKTNQLTNQTDHAFSHLIDALRYAYSNIYTNNKLRTEKLFLGI